MEIAVGASDAERTGELLKGQRPGIISARANGRGFPVKTIRGLTARPTGRAWQLEPQPWLFSAALIAVTLTNHASAFHRVSRQSLPPLHAAAPRLRLWIAGRDGTRKPRGDNA